MVPDPVPQAKILDLLDFLEKMEEGMLSLKLESLLAKLEEEGYGYVSKNANVSPSVSIYLTLGDSDDSAETTALDGESTSRP